MVDLIQSSVCCVHIYFITKIIDCFKLPEMICASIGIMRKWDPLNYYENRSNTINKIKFSSMLRTRFTKSNIKYFVPSETSRNTYQVSIFSFEKKTF